MTGNQDLYKLQELLKQKKSKAFYAEKLGVTIEHVQELLKELKGAHIELVDESQKKVNNDKGTLESTVEVSYEPKNDLELAKLHKIDLSKYKIYSYW